MSALGAAGYGDPDDVRLAADFRARPALRAQGFALGYLRAVAAGAGLLGLLALALYEAAQQRRRTVASVLLARMGLSRRAAAGSSLVELLLLGGLGALLGVGLALPLARLLLRRLDPAPDLPPDPVFAVPAGTLLLVVAGVLLTAALGAVLVDRAARRTPGGEVLRGAE